MAERVAWYRGRIVPESEVLIPFRDAGFTRGDGVYDSARTFAGEIFRLDAHLDRLWRSLAYVGLESPLARGELAEVSREVARRNVEITSDDVWVTQRITGGSPPDWSLDPVPSLVVESLPIPFATRAHLYRDGARVITPTLRRTPPWAMSPQAKTTSLLNLELGRREVQAVDPGAWAMLTDEFGNLAEGSGANIFVVRGGVLATPLAQYVLPGVTRDAVLELAAGLGIPTEERPIDLFDAYTADEVVITSTSLCACPVASINGRPIAGGAVPGPITRRLQDAFSAQVGVDIVEQYLRHLPERTAQGVGAR